jgi:amino acid transporter
MTPKPSSAQLKDFSAISKQRSEKHFGWLRNIVAMATGLVSVIVSLRSGKSSTVLEHYLFVSTVSLLALGILLGSIALYAEVHLWTRIQKEYGRLLKQVEAGTYTGQTHFLTESKPIFGRVEDAAYICLSMALVALIGFAWVSDY